MMKIYKLKNIFIGRNYIYIVTQYGVKKNIDSHDDVYTISLSALNPHPYASVVWVRV
jgi:hypothetical protein